MHIYFVNYHHFRDASGIHIHFLANNLVASGVPCTVCVPDAPESVHGCGLVEYETMTYAQLMRKALMRPWKLRSEKAIIHAWTPRECVRRFVTPLSRITGIPYLVHLEDNEDVIFESKTGLSCLDFRDLPFYRRPKVPRSIAHPVRSTRFLERSTGVTCIIDTLREHVPSTVPSMTFWPACELDFFELRIDTGHGLREKLGIPDDATVITYTGNTHKSNREEVETLYAAVAALNKTGSVYLIRCGKNHTPLNPKIKAQAEPFTFDFGSLPACDLIDYINAADILVQPGKAGRFNDYRFPSKVPMYLASGRPVILPESNIGLHLTDGVNAVLLRTGTVDELVTAIHSVMTDPDLSASLGNNGREFAKRSFNWETSKNSLLDFYESKTGLRRPKTVNIASGR